MEAVLPRPTERSSLLAKLGEDFGEEEGILRQSARRARFKAPTLRAQGDRPDAVREASGTSDQLRLWEGR